MSRRDYLRAALGQRLGWLKAVEADPSPAMRPRHIALVRLAIRMLEKAGR